MPAGLVVRSAGAANAENAELRKHRKVRETMESKRKIEVDRVYSTKIGNTYKLVRITRSLGHGRYEGTALPDGTTVKTTAAAIKGAGQTVEQYEASQRPRERANAAPAPTSSATDATPAGATTATRPKRGRRAAAQTAAAAAPPAAVSNTAATARANATTKTAEAAPVPGVKRRKVSGLDAAVMVLKEAGEPLNCGEIMNRMLESGLWKTGGKTPASTLYSAIVTEISKKGDASRFRKTERGKFTLTAAANAGKVA